MYLDYSDAVVMHKELGRKGLEMCAKLSGTYHVFGSISDLVRWCGMDCNGDVSNGSKLFKKIVKLGYINVQYLGDKAFICCEPSKLEWVEHRIAVLKGK